MERVKRGGMHKCLQVAPLFQGAGPTDSTILQASSLLLWLHSSISDDLQRGTTAACPTPGIGFPGHHEIALRDVGNL